MQQTKSNSRRKFLSAMAMGVTAGSLSVLTNPVFASDSRFQPIELVGADEWFKKIKGKHKIVYDGAMPNGGFPVIWNWAFYESNNGTGSEDKDITAVTVFRHEAIGLGYDDSIWEKYQLGKLFNMIDPQTKEPFIRNPYFDPKKGDFPLPSIQGIKKLQERGGLFCVCDLATKKLTMDIANKLNSKPGDVYEDWIKHILPDVQLVPSGVWALGRAQEHGCGYIYAG